MAGFLMVLRAPRQGMELKFFELTQKVLEGTNLELYDMDWNPTSGNLVVYIQNPETKSALIDDCMEVDRGFTPFMETETWIPDNFTLEVSSPGIYRQLTTAKHFMAVVNEEITVNLNKKVDEEKYPDYPKALRNNLKIKVKLLSATEEGIVIDVKGLAVEVPYTQIKKANLEADISNLKD